MLLDSSCPWQLVIMIAHILCKSSRIETPILPPAHPFLKHRKETLQDGKEMTPCEQKILCDFASPCLDSSDEAVQRDASRNVRCQDELWVRAGAEKVLSCRTRVQKLCLTFQVYRFTCFCFCSHVPCFPAEEYEYCVLTLSSVTSNKFFTFLFNLCLLSKREYPGFGWIYFKVN